MSNKSTVYSEYIYKYIGKKYFKTITIHYSKYCPFRIDGYFFIEFSFACSYWKDTIIDAYNNSIKIVYCYRQRLCVQPILLRIVFFLLLAIIYHRYKQSCIEGYSVYCQLPIIFSFLCMPKTKSFFIGIRL